MSQYLVPTSIELGAHVRGLRRQRGWTQAQLAEQAGLLPKTLSAIEGGTGQVLLANVMRCLSALEVDLLIVARARTQTRLEPEPQAHGSPEPTRVRVRPATAKPPSATRQPPVAIHATRKAKHPKTKKAENLSKSAASDRAIARARSLKEQW